MFSEVDLWPTEVAHIKNENHDLVDSPEKLSWSRLRSTSQWAPSQCDWALLASCSKFRQCSWGCIYLEKKTTFDLYKCAVCVNGGCESVNDSGPASRARWKGKNLHCPPGVLLWAHLKTTNLSEQSDLNWCSTTLYNVNISPQHNNADTQSLSLPRTSLLLQLPSVEPSGWVSTLDFVTWPFYLKLLQLFYKLVRDMLPALDFCFWTGQNLSTVHVYLLIK